jgi:Protein of unknown function (DUF3591)
MLESVCLLMQKKKELTPTNGHVVLLEYTEEHPLLLGRPGERGAAV